MLRLLIYSLLLTGASIRLDAANCPAGGHTIFFGNGILTDFAAAELSEEMLQTGLVAATLPVDQSCLAYALAYDSVFVAPSSTANTILDFILQVGVISSVQWIEQNVNQLLLWLSNAVGAPDWFTQAIQAGVTAATAVFQPDLQRHVSQYQFEIDQGNNVIVVAHSQGNFYANQASALLSAGNAFAIVGVANPASVVARGGPYVTLDNDIILIVPGSLRPNTDDGLSSPCASSGFGARIACHSFSDSYLAYSPSDSIILNDVIKLLKSGSGATVTVTKSGTGSGTVTSSPAGISCGAICSAPFAVGTFITLIPSPAAGSAFAGWSGDCDSSGMVNISRSGNNCTATFNSSGTGATVTVTKSGTGSGTVTSSPAGISCGAICSAPFAVGAFITLIPSPAAGSAFAGWSGDCTSSGMVTISGSGSHCTATFNSSGSGATVTVTKSGTGSGTVTSSPAGISCGTICSAPFAVGAFITLIPSPATGSSFAGWSGDCTSSGMVTVSSTTKNCTATFNGPGTVTVTKSGTGSGDVTSRPAGISCGSICSARFTVGTFITLIPSPAAGSIFAGWGGDCLNETLFVTASGKNCMVTFKPAPTYPLTVTISGDGYINSIYNPPVDTFVHDCHGTCTFNFPVGATVYVTAVPTHPDPTKRIWTGDCIPSPPTGSGASVVMNGPKACTATFGGSGTTGNLQVINSGTGSDFGTVSSSPSGIACGTLCSNGFTIGSSVTLTATGSSHASFVGFSGNCVVNDPFNHPNVCTAAIQSGTVTVVATFTYVQ